MNEKPHAHNPAIRDYEAGWNVMYVQYGDTDVYLYPFPIRHIGPFRRRVTEGRVRRAVQRAVAKHDRGSIRAGQREEKREQAKALLADVRSDWYMDSQQRMDDLHAEALCENNYHQINDTSGISTFQAASVQRRHFIEVY